MSDLSRLFLPPPDGPAQPAQFRQAVLVEFNADDGTNVVQIGDSQIPNLKLAITGAEIGLESGDNILVMYLGNTAMIWCKIATPGGANYGASNNGRAGFRKTGLTSFGASTTGTTVYTDTSITVPEWANSGLVILFGAATVTNSGVNNQLDSQVQLACPGQTTVTGTGFNVTVPAGFAGSTYSIVTDVVPLTPGATLTITYLTGAGGTFAPAASDHAEVSASVQFFRESAS